MFSFFKRKKGKKRFLFSIGKKIKDLFSRKRDVFPYEDLEKLFYEADLGVDIAINLTKQIEDLYKKNKDISLNEIISYVEQDILKNIKETYVPPPEPTEKCHVIMIVGANGSGKTTNLAKLANYYKNKNKKVLIIAADTFRAAAVEQLTSWAEKTKIDIIKSQPNSDPSSVVFDGLQAAKARGIDVVLIDTAGRLHTKTNLMGELEKIKKVCKKHIETAPHETLLVLDATIGQNALDQAKIFNQYTPISGIILSKLDGTAKGGIIVSIQKNMNIPVQWVGTGESIEDIDIFNPEKFTKDLLSINE